MDTCRVVYPARVHFPKVQVLLLHGILRPKLKGWGEDVSRYDLLSAPPGTSRKVPSLNPRSLLFVQALHRQHGREQLF